MAVQAAERLGEGAVAVERLEAQVGHPRATSRTPCARARPGRASAEIGRSAARGAGVSPTMSRIHEAWRASTETIREASASAALVRLVAAPL